MAQSKIPSKQTQTLSSEHIPLPSSLLLSPTSFSSHTELPYSGQTEQRVELRIQRRCNSNCYSFSRPVLVFKGRGSGWGQGLAGGSSTGTEGRALPVPGDEPAVPTGTSAPAFFACHGSDVPNRLFPSSEEGLAPAQGYLAEGGTEDPTRC